MRVLDYDRKRISFWPIGVFNVTKRLKLFEPMNLQHPNYSQPATFMGHRDM